ncbi:MAG TPA: DUF4245 domain-containing protein [Micromonosporaceae bacterium]|nr:DUF4245 domain-containing protein [Micromonosporaceae bacterium]
MSDAPDAPTGLRADAGGSDAPDERHEPTAPGRHAAPERSGAVNTIALRAARTPMDMAKAVLVLLVPVLVAFGIYVFFFGGSNAIAIDPSGTYSEAQAARVFPVVQPHGLPSGWQPVSSTYGDEKGRHVLRVGYVAPSGAGLQLIESDGPSATVLSNEIGTANPVGPSVDLGGRTWGQVGAGSSHQRALVDTEKGYTIIVKGQATAKDLATFAASLR